MAAWKWLHRQMNSLVPLQVVISIKALWALVATEWPVVWWIGLLRVMSVHLRVLSSVAAVESGHHAMWHATSNQGDLAAGVIDIRQNGHLIAVGPVLRILWLLRWLLQ